LRVDKRDLSGRQAPQLGDEGITDHPRYPRNLPNRGSLLAALRPLRRRMATDILIAWPAAAVIWAMLFALTATLPQAKREVRQFLFG